MRTFASGLRKSLQATAAVLLLALSSLVRAHDPGLSTALIRVEASRIEVQITFAPVDVAILIGGPTYEVKVPDLFQNARLDTLARESAEVLTDARKFSPEVTKVQLDDQNNVHFNLRISGLVSGPAVVRCALLDRLPRGHRQFVTVVDAEGKSLGDYLVHAGQDEIKVNLSGAITDNGGQTNSFTGFLSLGVHHILTGYDHLLFLFALLLVSRGMLATAKLITCFTIAHSLTLMAATFNLIPLQSRIVEPIIAASIVYVGVENLVKHGEPKWRGALTFVFGLVHGLGFAGVLREMGVGAAGGGVAVPLFSFNLGVELGQIAVAAVALPLIGWARRRPKFASHLMPACSAAVVLAGGFWVVERAFDLQMFQ